jgi:hypothetical protein
MGDRGHGGPCWGKDTLLRSCSSLIMLASGEKLRKLIRSALVHTDSPMNVDIEELLQNDSTQAKPLSEL